MICAASDERTGALQGGEDAPVLTLRYAAPEAGASAEWHILYTPSYHERFSKPDTQTFARKQAFETQRLRDWLDVGLS
jgi:hypothetical protein